MSPFGLPEGMDTPEMNKKMEDCVSRVMKTGKSKGSAIPICKNSILNSKSDIDNAEAGFLDTVSKLRNEIYDMEYKENDHEETKPPEYSYELVDVFDKYFIVMVYKAEDGTDELYKVNYSLDGNKLKIDWGAKKKVKQLMTYEQSEEISPSIRYFEVKSKNEALKNYL